MRSVGFILAGGESKRLFPWKSPKPLLEIKGASLLEQAAKRLGTLDEVFVVTNGGVAAEFRKYFAKKSGPGTKMRYLNEPEPRDTAAAVGFALRSVRPKPDWVAVLSGDQYFPDVAGFKQFMKMVEKEIQKFPDSLFLAGSVPNTKAKNTHSQFGWVLPGAKTKGAMSLSVEKFVEKPRGARLSKIRNQGGLINAGMFFGKYETFVRAYEQFFPTVLRQTCRYSRLERQPIDRAIFEKFEKVRVFPLKLRWEDLGTWETIAQEIPPSSHTQVKSKKNFVWNDLKDQEIHLFGVDDLAVIQTKGKTLIMPLSETSKLKDYLSKVSKKTGA